SPRDEYLSEIECLYGARDGRDERERVLHGVEPHIEDLIRLRLEAEGFSVARHLGREPQPDGEPVERQDTHARHGVRGIALPGIAARGGESRQSVRHSHLPVAAGEIEAGGRILGGDRRSGGAGGSTALAGLGGGGKNGVFGAVQLSNGSGSFEEFVAKKAEVNGVAGGHHAIQRFETRLELLLRGGGLRQKHLTARLDLAVKPAGR